MPEYEQTSLMFYQFFPGEMPSNGAQSLGANGLHGPVAIPADYYSDPERSSFQGEPSRWSYAEERRAALALYDYRGADEDFSESVVSE